MTTYQYDGLGNLLDVHQSNQQQDRQFNYDSLSRLLAASNPESGTAQYGYDADGNVLTRTDARNITTTYGYDNLNRLTSKSYSDTTPAVGYTWDVGGCLGGPSPCYNVGRRTAMTDAAGSEAWSYNWMGHLLADQRTTNGATLTFTYAPNYDGSIASISYPGGR